MVRPEREWKKSVKLLRAIYEGAPADVWKGVVLTLEAHARKTERDAWLRHQLEGLDTEGGAWMAARVIAFPGVTLERHELSPRERALTEPPCAFCKVALGDMAWTCLRCDAVLHVECFWGRIATLEEWTAYIRRVMETDDEFEADVVCAACRQREGLK